jgi:hypothetical protein
VNGRSPTTPTQNRPGCGGGNGHFPTTIPISRRKEEKQTRKASDFPICFFILSAAVKKGHGGMPVPALKIQKTLPKQGAGSVVWKTAPQQEVIHVTAQLTKAFSCTTIERKSSHSCKDNSIQSRPKNPSIC